MTTISTKLPLEDYLINKFYDKDLNGFYVAVEHNTIVSDDKKLEDQIWSLLALASSNYKIEDLCEMSKSLDRYYDEYTNTYHELTDRFGIVHSAGMVRHTHIQLLTSYGLLVIGKYTNSAELVEKGLNLFETIHETVLMKGSPSILNANLTEHINPNKYVLSNIFAILTLEEAYKITEDSLYLDYMKSYISEIYKFEDQKYGGVYDYLLTNNEPFKSKGKKTFSNALATIALYKAHETLQDPVVIEKGKSYFDFIVNNLKHPLTGGFWNKANYKGEARVEPVESYYNNDESPFPVKYTHDQALLFLCTQLISQYYKATEYKSLAEDLLYQVNKFKSKDGGMFIGQGNWFSTPTDPTVPLIRHFMVPHHTPGAFYAGNTGYLPLHEKQAKTQAITLWVLNTANASLINEEKDINLDMIPKHKSELKQNLDTITYHKDIKLKIDEKSYLNWLDKTKSGAGFGLTPYKSPLGFRSDKSPQNFSALHVVSDLTIMGEKISNEDRESILRGMFDCQNEDGGFAEQPGHLSEVFTTYCVILTAYILKSKVPNEEKCIEFIQRCQNEDGGFGNSEGYPSDVWHTNLAVLGLHAMNATPLRTDKCLAFVAACQNDDFAYGVTPNAPSETFSVFRAIDTLLVLGKQPTNYEETIKWLKQCQTENGGFRYKPNANESFVGSYHAIAALYLLGELPLNAEKCKEWLSEHQSKDGGFSRAINAPSDTTDEGFICLQASYMLERNLNPYWVAIIT